MPSRVAAIRRLICRGCPHPCLPYREGEIDHDSLDAFCPVAWKGQWHPLRQLAAPSAQPRTTITEKMGRAAWREATLRALAGTLTDEWIDSTWIYMIPAWLCGCSTSYRVLRKRIPLRPDDQFGTITDWHNAVNLRLNKPQWTIEQARSYWSAVALQDASQAVASSLQTPSNSIPNANIHAENC